METVMIRNGVDLGKLSKIVSADKADPGKAQLRFKADTTWIKGARSSTKIKEFTLEADEPEVLLGTGLAPNAVKMVLAALGSCLFSGIHRVSNRGRFGFAWLPGNIR